MVDDVGLLPASLLPSRMPVTGTATSSSSAVAATANARGRRSISALKRAQRGDSCSPSAIAGTLTRRPNAPSRAGRSVSEPTIVNSTASAAAIAGPLRNEMPSSTMPSSATTTVEPANSTERPAVSMAVRVAARTLRAGGALAAEAADDQQGVIDADAEGDHHRQRRGEVGDVEDRRGGEDERHRQPDRRERHDQRHGHRGQRAQHEQEHDDGDGDADELAGALWRLLGDLDGLAPELDLQAACRPRLGGVDDALDVGLVELVGLAVEEHRRECHLPVARDGARPGERALHRGYVGQALDAVHDGVDLRVALSTGEAPVAHGEDDLAGVPGLLGEALLEEVEGALGLGPRQREVVDEPAARSGGEGERRGDGGDPGGHDEAAAVVGKGG